MSIARDQFEQLVVVPVLDRLGLPSKDKARALLMAIAAYGSSGGRYGARGLAPYLKQVKGPALGPWQMEPATHDLVRRRIAMDQDARTLRAAECVVGGESDQLTWNHRYACAMARLLLWFNPAPLPDVNDKRGQYDYYLDTWRPGKPPTFEKFVRAGEEWR